LPRKQPPDQHIKRMADLLRQGATLTELACPACASPLFRFKGGGLWCEKCGKKVVVVRDGEKMSEEPALDALEKTLLAKIQQIHERIQHEDNAEELRKLGASLSELLEALERTRRTRKA